MTTQFIVTKKIRFYIIVAGHSAITSIARHTRHKNIRSKQSWRKRSLPYRYCCIILRTILHNAAKCVLHWGESVSELMIKKKKQLQETVLSYLCVFKFCTCSILICLLCTVASIKLCCVYCCSWVVCVLSYVYFLYHVCIAVFFYFTLGAGLLARSQYSEGPATGHLDTGISWFPCV